MTQTSDSKSSCHPHDSLFTLGLNIGDAGAVPAKTTYIISLRSIVDLLHGDPEAVHLSTYD